MKLTHDPEHNLAYLYLVDEPLPNSVARTLPGQDGTGNRLNYDYNREGHLIGIEFLDAKGTLTEDILATAGRE